MQRLYSEWNSKDKDRDANNRLLRRLRFALLFWLVAFFAVAIWFTNSPGF